METLVQLILIIALLKYCLKAALSGSIWSIVGYAAAAAAVSIALYSIVIEQPLTIITDMLSNRTTVTNVALITTAEAIAGIFISIYLLDNYFKPKSKRTKTTFVLKIMPGVLVLFSIAYFELLFFKLHVGGDFFHTAILYASLLFVSILLIGFIVKNTLNRESLMLEVKVILNISILIIGLLVSSSVANYNVSHAQTTIEWKALLILTIAALALITLGIIFPKINLKNILKK